MKRIASYLLTIALALTLAAPAAGAVYSDVPTDSSLAAEVQKATEYGLMNGYTSATFGYADSMTRAQFVTVLDRMLGPDRDPFGEKLSVYITAAMELPDSIPDPYYRAISHASECGWVDTAVPFRPDDSITRGEMAEMLVRALGLNSAAETIRQLWSSRASAQSAALPFTDVSGDSAGYIAVAYEIGMTKGTSATTFSPDATATRAQAAAMLVRIYEKTRQAADFIHGFYAISSYSQLSLAERMDAVSAGWSRMTWDGETALLATTGANGNEFAVPSGYQDVTAYLEEHDVPLHLNVFMDASGGVAELLSSERGRAQAVEQVVNELTVSYNAIGKNPYSGVTVDFEGLRSARKADFTAFLTELANQVHAMDKSLYACVSPALYTGAYYDGYDYRAIGNLADRVILMAYDYEARNAGVYVGKQIYSNGAVSREFAEFTRNAPVGQVFYSLLAITDPVTGVADTSKILLGLSAKNIAWQIDENGALVSATPVYVSNATVYQRLQQGDSIQNGDVLIYTTQTHERYLLWRENPAVNLRTAKLLGINGVSLWRLGTIPLYDGWSWEDLLS